MNASEAEVDARVHEALETEDLDIQDTKTFPKCNVSRNGTKKHTNKCADG